jgi:hypothetical protein
MFPPWAPFFLGSRQAPLSRRRERGLGDGDDLTASAQRQVGIVQSFSGTIGSSYKSSGVVMTAPWNHILKENIGL